MIVDTCGSLKAHSQRVNNVRMAPTPTHYPSGETFRTRAVHTLPPQQTGGGGLSQLVFDAILLFLRLKRSSRGVWLRTALLLMLFYEATSPIASQTIRLRPNSAATRAIFGLLSTSNHNLASQAKARVSYVYDHHGWVEV